MWSRNISAITRARPRQRDGVPSGAAAPRAAAAGVNVRPAPLPGRGRRESAGILRMKLSAARGRFASWRRTCLEIPRAILPLALLVTLWLDDYAGADGLRRWIYLLCGGWTAAR